ncbi:MAG: IMPACT family protein [Candidatus Dactylopiibacterium carminicum]|uniref:IMPACT family protein n=1 Tax=Candidatus Dactylopiibacterium carminicum TaxID=857335 RepID=A0A272ES85_9RHOO|nr:YigZ family protein [Candidatus Dactylopiibacterium carminicum]KAF7600671.1 IMPACT family protein [Candidatus Dactylopiibacterium carminicum]PAS92974.1 MAG: IMPACT family protein [Candidatus Dactylopiibacterium carminicum]PAS96521.1 MAG: IMPACT family protein [Candidatus Dactylopiibacterium carminicum]PAT00673.1 MAG: IMPACT family protein [Candidatus Dactylopiibacterium carminicum]
MPYSIATPVDCELVIKKSRFLGCVQPVADRATAQKIVAALWAQHPGAAHVCWALLAGGDSAAVDDGEPGGTAGRPMLEVLRLQELEGVLATVVRYYGGVKLGAGGLVRAYTDAVAQPLRTAQKVPLIRLCTLCCEAPYSLEGMIRRGIDAAGATLAEVRHGQAVTFSITLPEVQAAPFMAQLSASGQGRIQWLETAE